MQELVRFLTTHDNFAVLGHVCPDGDTTGSSIALAAALQALGKRVLTYLPEEIEPRYRSFPVPVSFAWGDMELPFEPETAFCVDVSDFKRMGGGEKIYNACKAHALLDHHPTNPGFGEVQYINGKAASTGELAVELIHLLGVTLTRDMGTWLYTAMCTDCGQFGFPSTRPETMEAAAACLRAGIDVGDITKKVYRTRSESRTRLLAAILSGMETTRSGEICYARLTEQMLENCHACRADADGDVNYLVEVQGVRIAFLAEQRGTQTKLSLRSNPPVNISQTIAQPLGGGGHANAAGVTLDLPMEEAVETILARARQLLDELDREKERA